MSNSPTKRLAAFRDAVNKDMHTMQLGEKGMPEYTDFGVGSNVLAISQLVRGGDPASLADEILAMGSPQDVTDLMVLAFVTRNARGGKGEKDLSYKLFLRIWPKYPETAKQLLGLFAHYGYWKDYLHLMALAKEDPTVKGLDEAVMDIMQSQLQKDMASVAAYKLVRDESKEAEADPTSKPKSPTVSLLAKWLPREGSSVDKKVSFVQRFAACMWPALNKDTGDKDAWQSSVKSKYRKTVSELTSYLELPEVLLAVKREDEINFQKVASKATLLLTKTFINVDKKGKQRSNDPKRLKMTELFIKQLLTKGLKGGQVMPHEIVRKILNNRNIIRSEELVLDAQWKDLWKKVVEQVNVKAKEEGLEFDPTRMVPLSDVSGSMTGVPMEVSIALGIGLSEITHKAFQNMVLTFESTPHWHRLLPTDSIVKKVRSLAKAPWGGSTNFLGAYEQILDVCKKHKLPREDMPSLIVFSDMQFDQAAGVRQYHYAYHDRSVAPSSVKDVHAEIKAKVAAVAAELGWSDPDPTPIVFWNLRNTSSHPVDKDTEGAVMLSGFSPSLLKLVMNGEALREEEVEVVQEDGTIKTEKVRVTPEQVLRKMLEDSLYDPVRKILVESNEGALVEYGTLDKEMEKPAGEDDGAADEEKAAAKKPVGEDDADFEMVSAN